MSWQYLVIAILGTFEIAKTCDAVVRGVSSHGELIHSQIMDSCREKGSEAISRIVAVEFASEQDRMKSYKLLEETLEKMRATKRGSLEPRGKGRGTKLNMLTRLEYIHHK